MSEIPCCVNVNMRYLTRFFSWEGYNYARKGEVKSYEKIFRCSNSMMNDVKIGMVLQTLQINKMKELIGRI